MEGYEKPNQGDVKLQETLMMGNFAKHKNHKPHMQNITQTMGMVNDTHN
jgi:hypothetical protein